MKGGETLNTRIYELRKFLNLTQLEFSNTIGIKGGSLSDMENGKAPITERTIITICAKFNVNEDWLRNGTGEMFNIIDVKYEEFFKIYNNLSEPLHQFLLNKAKELLKTQSNLNI